MTAQPNIENLVKVKIYLDVANDILFLGWSC